MTAMASSSVEAIERRHTTHLLPLFSKLLKSSTKSNSLTLISKFYDENHSLSCGITADCCAITDCSVASDA